jgi:excisionase family DNA binding protein
MAISLAEAAQRVGIHRSNLLRAIKAGRISGTRDDAGSWQIDPAELVRVYGDLHSATLQPAQPDALLQLKLEHAEQRCCELTRRAERAEREADEWRDQARRVALPSPSAMHQVTQPSTQPGRWQRAWRWLRQAAG